MDGTIISALIATFAGGISYIITSAFGPDGPFQTGRKVKILENQLFYVFEPLVKLIRFDPSFLEFDQKAFLHSFRKIIYENYSLVPPPILSICDSLENCSEQQQIPADLYLKIRYTCISYWNFAKKKLGYPFIESEIRLEYLDDLLQLQKRKNNFKRAVFISFSYLVCATYPILMMYVILKNSSQTNTWFENFLVFLSILESAYIGYALFHVPGLLLKQIKSRIKPAKGRNQPPRK